MNLIILGPAGSGKGTQAEKLADRFNLVHVDMGRLLRQVAKMPTELGKRIDEIIHVKKELVPSSIAKEVLHLKLGSIPREQGIIFDGVPRNVDQMEYIDEALQEFGRRVDKVFHINISQEEGVRRISKRVICEKCKAGFILGRDVKKLSEQCPVCEGGLIQRADDTPEGVEKRFQVFEKETTPIFRAYEERGLLVLINGEKSVEEVFEKLIEDITK